MSSEALNKASFTRGGVHPHENKALVSAESYLKVPNPAELVIHLNQHLGKPSCAVVKARDEVEALAKVGEASGFVSVNVHTPLAGTVKSVDSRNLLGMQGQAVHLIVTPEQDEYPGIESDPPEPDFEALSVEEIVEKVKEAGLVGMGGATFPTHVKLAPPPGLSVDTVVINGAECEPYLTADDCLMRNHPKQIVYGLLLLVKALGAEKGIVALEDNKPEAAEKLKAEVVQYSNLSVTVMKTLYPQGSEKQLIDATTGRIVPCGKLPAHVGVVVQNVATTAAVYEAVQFSRPLVRRLITISGRAVKNPRNVLAPVGISGKELLEFCGGATGEIAAVVYGGPMMGRATNKLETPVTKGTSGILFLTAEEVGAYEEKECLRCGRCAKVCPMGIIPVNIMNKVKHGLIDQIDEFDHCKEEINSCFECGTCTYACPANKRLTEWTRLGKYELRSLAAKKQKGGGK